MRHHGLCAIDHHLDEGAIAAIRGKSAFRGITECVVPIVELELVGLTLNHIDFGAPEGALLANAGVGIILNRCTASGGDPGTVQAAVKNLATGQAEEGVIAFFVLRNSHRGTRRIDFF